MSSERSTTDAHEIAGASRAAIEIVREPVRPLVQGRIRQSFGPQSARQRPASVVTCALEQLHARTSASSRPRGVPVDQELVPLDAR